MRIFDALQICMEPKDKPREDLEFAARTLAASYNRAIEALENARSPIIKAIGGGIQLGLGEDRLP